MRDYWSKNVLKSALGSSSLPSSFFLWPHRYMAPEKLEQSKGDGRRADVWSYGMTLYEICVREAPFEGLDVSAVTERIRRADFADFKLPAMPRCMQLLFGACCDLDPKVRPTFEEFAVPLTCWTTSTSASNWQSQELWHSLAEEMTLVLAKVSGCWSGGVQRREMERGEVVKRPAH